MVKGYYEGKLIKRFKDKQAFTRNDLYNFYLKFEPELKDGTLGWRIYDLKKKNVIKSVGKGIYTLYRKPEYTPSINNSLKKIAGLLSKNFLELKYCIWDSNWLNEFTNHQTGSHFIVLEVEKELMNSVFFNLKDNNIKDLFLQPGEKEIEMYVLEKENPVLLKYMISRSPLREITAKNLRINVPVLEKILTDLYCDRDIFYFFAGKELENIFENALSHYTIDFSRLFNYARRRGKEAEIKEFMIENFNYLLKDFVK